MKLELRLRRISINYLKLGLVGFILYIGACTEFNTDFLNGGTKDNKVTDKAKRSTLFLNQSKLIRVSSASNNLQVGVTLTYDFDEYDSKGNLDSVSSNKSRYDVVKYCLNVKTYNLAGLHIGSNVDLMNAEDFECTDLDWKDYSEVERELFVPWNKTAILNVKMLLPNGKEEVYERLFLRHYLELIDYPITCDDFITYLHDGYWFALTEDIDCSGYSFDIVVDRQVENLHIIGNGHVVRNIDITYNGYGNAGLVGKVSNSSYVYNLGIEQVHIDSNSSTTGGLFGEIDDSLIDNVYVSGGTVSGIEQLGGLVGLAKNSIIRGVYTDLDNITENGELGALIGRSSDGMLLINNVSKGTVTGLANWVGGLVGTSSDTTIINNKSSVVVEGGLSVGGLVGRAINNTIRGSSSSGPVHAVSYNDVYADGTGGLVGSAINTSITYSSSSSTVSAEYGSHNTGGLVGFMNEFSHVDYSSASGAVSSLYNSAGGLIGYLYNDSYDEQTHNVSNSHANGSVTGKFIIGGLIARADATIIEKVYATGKVTSNYEDSNGYAGGLIGFFVDAELYDSYATGHVEACTLSTIPCDSVGGLIGRMTGDIYDPKVFNSYALGSVLGTERIGSLVGHLTVTATVHGGYATGAVTGSGQYVGGVFGYRSPNADVENIYSLYADTSLGVTVLTEAEFGAEASFVGFDFSSGWVMQGRMRCIDIRRPHLFWEPAYNSRFACAVMD